MIGYQLTRHDHAILPGAIRMRVVGTRGGGGGGRGSGNEHREADAQDAPAGASNYRGVFAILIPWLRPGRGRRCEK
jgi:hypothetical protein